MLKILAIGVLSSIALSCALRASDKLNSLSSNQLSPDMAPAKVECTIFDRTPKKEFVEPAVKNSLNRLAATPKEEDPNLVKREILVIGSTTQKIDLSDAQYFVHVGVYTGNFQIQVYDRSENDYVSMAEAAEHGFSSLNLYLKSPVVDVRCELIPADPTNAK